MRLDIILPITINILILGIITAGIISGKKNGFLYELLKFVFILGMGVGIYFLLPILTDACLKIPFIVNLINNNLITVVTLKSIIFTTAFILLYLLISLIFVLIKHNKYKHTKILTNSISDRKYVNSANIIKTSSTNRKDTKKLKKEQKRFIKQQKQQEKELLKVNTKPLTKKQKVFGIIFGLLISIIIGFVVTLPTKYIFNEIATTQPSLSDITKGYEYTIYGQLDKLTDIDNFIIKD